MSLTRHLLSKRSPIRTWFEQRFPVTQSVATKANRELRDGRECCEVGAPEGSDASLVGTAVDYLLRCHLSAGALDRTVARNAALFLDPTGMERGQELERSAAARVQDLAPWERPLSAAEMRELAVACAILARFEQWYRAGPAVAAFIKEPLGQLGIDDGIEEFAALVVDRATISDIAGLGSAAVEDHLDLRDATPLRLNPKFAQSAPIGGADADVIAGHDLWDWKATRQRGIAGRFELWQLVGYVLCDTDDLYALERVGVSALRWRRRLSWSIDELLEQLAGAPLQSVTALRREFADLVASVAFTRADWSRALLDRRA